MTLTESRIPDLPARPARQDAARPLTKDEELARLVAAAQAQRLRDLWCESRDAARNGTKGSPAFARVADLAAAYAAMAVRAGERQKARAVVGDALTTLRGACVADRTDPARHLAFARTLELAAAYEVAGGDARAAFDALRAAIASCARAGILMALTTFAPRVVKCLKARRRICEGESSWPKATIRFSLARRR